MSPRTNRRLALLSLLLSGVVVRLCLAVLTGWGVARETPTVDVGHVAQLAPEPDDRRLAPATPSVAATRRFELELATRWRPAEEWKELYATYARHGAEESFRRRYDAVAVRPLGVDRAEYRRWLAARVAAGLPVPAEPVPSLRDRTSDLNRSLPSLLSSRAFQVFGFADGDRLDVVVGDARGGLELGVDDLAYRAAAQRGRSLAALAPAAQEAARQATSAWHAAYFGAPLALWRALDRRGESESTPPTSPSVAIVLVVAFRLHVVERGQDAETDALLAATAVAESSARDAIRRLFP